VLDSHGKEASRQCDGGVTAGVCACAPQLKVHKRHRCTKCQPFITYSVLSGQWITDWVNHLVVTYQTSEWATDVGVAQQRSEM